MDKAIIFGMFDFVGFHVGKNLLNKGIEVNGVHIDEFDNIDFLDEKRLEVGRNANFLEKSLFELENSPREDISNTRLIFSIYDLFMLKKEQILQNEEVIKPIIQYIEDNNKNANIVFILPIQMLTRTFRGKEIEGFLSRINGLVKNTQILYLPAIYGPWQPLTFLFQQAIVSKFKKTDITHEEREWISDVIFVDDAIESILEIIEKGKPGSYLIESGSDDQWFRCASYLKIDENQARLSNLSSIQGDLPVLKVTVRKVTPISASILAQMEHVQRLYENRL
ncbi:hypothetical protein J7E63_20565 [Bacillus sp. ISL-75]|uniref:hypothetical protein n=1 Tax=Bacillus sp. ISL-75 TaxID=2819137 RepID=UPI001BEBDDF8|nr:hypothetical protein [Bacillus sp. ISL-75]MBT2729289.1 hypothetical protein [Bacillus sp. ISL-75]